MTCPGEQHVIAEAEQEPRSPLVQLCAPLCSPAFSEPKRVSSYPACSYLSPSHILVTQLGPGISSHCEMEPQRTIKLAKRRRVGKAAEKEGERWKPFVGGEKGKPPIGVQEVGGGASPGTCPHVPPTLPLTPGGLQLPPRKPKPPACLKGTSFWLPSAIGCVLQTLRISYCKLRTPRPGLLLTPSPAGGAGAGVGHWG